MFASQCIAGSVALSDPTYNRALSGTTCNISAVGTAVHYDTYEFTLGSCGNATSTSVTATLCGTSPCTAAPIFDSFITLYRKSDGSASSPGSLIFNPASTCTNFVIGDDDGCTGSAGLSRIIQTLSPGNFVIVVTVFDNSTTGAYNLSVDAPGCSITQVGCTPPTVLQNPSNQSACSGGSVSFTALASGSGNTTPTVQWQANTGSGFTNIGGATSTTLSGTTGTSPFVNGAQFQAVFTSAGCTATTTAATLTVNGAPTITLNPTDQTACANSTATFTASASSFGNTTPTVQWQSDIGSGFANIGGATSTTLTRVVGAGQFANGAHIRAVFTNSCGNTSTTAALLTVNTPPVVSQNPSDAQACSGDTVSFTAAATGTPTPTVKWQANTGSGFADIGGATSPTLSGTAGAGVFVDNALVRAVFQNSCGNITTTAALLRVGSAPVVTQDPADVQVCTGGNVTFTALASGVPAPSVRWFVNTGSGFNIIPGETSTTLTGTGGTGVFVDNARFRAFFQNACGNATTTAAVLRVGSAPVVTLDPVSQSGCVGGNVTFTSTASGTPAPNVRWQANTGSGFTNISGATSTTLTGTIGTGVFVNGTSFRAVFQNACGNVTSNAALLTVNVAPSVTTNPTNQTVCAGSTTTFTAAASGSPTPTVQWQVSTNGGGSFSDIAGATSTTLSFTATAGQNNNQYRAVFTNTCSTATTSAATLTVNTAPSVTTNPTNQTACSGNTVSFSAAASGTPTPGLQWQVSTNGGGTFTNIGGATSSPLTGTAGSGNFLNGNQFRATFGNSCGNATTTAAMLTVNVAPSVTTNPTNQTVCAGSTTTFTAAATGTPTPTVQWQVSTNGGGSFSDIAGATSTTLSFTATAGQNNNQYRAVFTNTCSTATTTAATLTVNIAPSVTTNPTSQTICSGSSVSFTAAASGSPTPTRSVAGVDKRRRLLHQHRRRDVYDALGIRPVPESSSTATSSGPFFANSCGNATTTAATLTVDTCSGRDDESDEPDGVRGIDATFTAAASGTPTPTVQWQVSTNGGGSFSDIAGATSTTLSFATTAGQNNNQYRAVFTNSCGRRRRRRRR